jgi:hypothetical protein
MGTYLGALVIYQGLLGVAPPSRPILGGASAGQADLLQRVAAEVVQQPR